MRHQLVLVALAAALASPAFGLTNSIPKGTETVKLSSVATLNLTTAGTSVDNTPQDLVFAPSDPTRLFIATRNGDIRIIANGVLNTTPFLSMPGNLVNPGFAAGTIFNGGEGGLLGMAFSPNYATDHTFYTLQTETFNTTGPAADYSNPEQFPTTATDPSNQITLRQWTASSNPNVANTNSNILLRINHPENNHQGGSIRFGTDGNLYIGLGDGGGGNDFNGSAGSTTDGHNNALGNGQDLTTALGKILRINPDPTPRAGFTISTNGKYSIPNSNTFISGANGALKEIYTYGMRNPYKIDVDAVTGKLYVADVGQSTREEVDDVVNGGNYGWPFREGTFDNLSGSGRGALPAGFASLPPIAEYTHADGIATIGGVLYRGSDPTLYGKYVFADLGGPTGTLGRLFYMDPADGNIFEFKYDTTGLSIPSEIYSLDAGPNGELYGLFSNGQVLSITVVPEPGTVLLLALPALGLLAKRRRRA